MKHIILIIMALATTLTASADSKKKAQNVQTVTFSVSMHCENCQKKIEGTVGWEKGVKDLKTDLDKKLVVIRYDTRKITRQQLLGKIQELGYEVVEIAPDDEKK